LLRRHRIEKTEQVVCSDSPARGKAAKRKDQLAINGSTVI
jgi:hypothetical protein